MPDRVFERDKVNFAPGQIGLTEDLQTESKNMRVKVAKTAGFCAGVRRATNMALELSKTQQGPIYTHGPLVHNDQAVQMLRLKGVQDVQDVQDKEKGTVIIRAHGVDPLEKASLEKQGFDVADATCPHIVASQKLILRHLKRGYEIILVGDQGHPEMLGLLGYSKDKGILICSEEQARELPHRERICVIAQTTFHPERYEKICEILQHKSSECKVFKTICNATRERQEEVLFLAQECDAILVVGGEESANTRRLYEIAKNTGKPSFFVRTELDLNMETLRSFHTIGVTAGASTPNWVIRSVVEHLTHKDHPWIRSSTFLKRYLWNICIDTHLFLGLGAVGLTYACALLAHREITWKTLAVSFLFVIGTHVIYRLNESAEDVFDDPKRAEFFQEYARPLLVLGWICSISALSLSWTLGALPFLVVLLCTLGALLYRSPLLLSLTGHKISLRNIPGSKDLALSVGWASISSLVPVFAHEGGLTGGSMVAFLYAFSMMFTRSNLFDVKEIQGDKIVGQEMLPVVLGKRRTQLLLILVTFCQGILLLFAFLAGWTPSLSLWLLFTVLYTWMYLGMYHRRLFAPRLLCGLVADGNFVLTGLVAWTWHLGF